MANGFSTRTGQGGFTGKAQKHDMAMDPTFAGDFGASTMAGATDAEIEALMGGQEGGDPQLNAIVEAVKQGVNQAIGSSPLAQQYSDIYNAAGADFPGVQGVNAVGTKFGSRWDALQNAEGDFVRVDNYDPSFPYVSQNYNNFGTAGLNVAGQGNVSRALQGQAGWGTKINDAIQSINPFKSDWAQKNLYGKQSVGDKKLNIL